MEKKTWEKPEMEVVKIDLEDVIETSDGNSEVPPPPDGGDGRIC